MEPLEGSIFLAAGIAGRAADQARKKDKMKNATRFHAQLFLLVFTPFYT